MSKTAHKRPRMKDLIIFGAGPFAELAHYYFERDSGYKVAAFTLDSAFL